MTPAALTERDLPDAIDLLARVGLEGGAKMLARYLRWQPDGAWKLEVDRTLIGTVTLLHQGRAGFIGCMAVDPAWQGSGLGRRLLEHAHREGRRAGLTTFLLEATPAGEPLYRRLGYLVDHESAIFIRDAGHTGAAPRIAATDFAALAAIDRDATGCDRAPMLANLVEDFGGTLSRDDGQLTGYAMVIGERLGPVIARTAMAGRALVDHLAPACTVAAASLANPAAIDALLANGFRQARPLRRMRLGPPIAARPDWVWTLSSPGSG